MKIFFALILALLFAACTDYQAEFDNAFGGLEYSELDNPDLSSNSNTESSNAQTPKSSGGDGASSETASASSSSTGNPTGTSSSDPTSSGVEPLSSEAVPTQSSEESSSSSAQSSSSSIVPYTPPPGSYGEMDYKEQKYRTVKIGDQEWMAENMNAVVDGSTCYRDSSKYCDMYGRLYKWEEAKTICPEGWRLPDTTDWTNLFISVGGKAQAATHLKATTSWTKNGDGNGDDAFGFSAFAAGGWNAAGPHWYLGEGNSTSFWTSVTVNSNEAWSVGMYWADSYPSIAESAMAQGLSVRCIKGEKVVQVPVCKNQDEDKCDYGSITDTRNSETYKTVQIGNQRWMAENLRYDAGTGSRNDSADTFLYTWEAAKTACPKGWHLPTKNDFEILIAAVGSIDALKSTSNEWYQGGYGKDSYGFSAQPVGEYDVADAQLENVHYKTSFWSETKEGGAVYALQLSTYNGNKLIGYTTENRYMISVRCIENE